MDQQPAKCAQCGFRFSNTESPSQLCPNCAERRTLRNLFWMLFLGTPLFASATAFLHPIMKPYIPVRFPPVYLAVTIILILGGFGAGYFLAKTHTHGAGLIPLSAFYTVGILLVYAFV